MKHTRLFILSVISIFTIFVLCACGGTSIKKGWQNDKLGGMLPTPTDKEIEVSANSDYLFQADVKDCSLEEYDAYVLACKDKGFNVKIIESDSVSKGTDIILYAFNASNVDGYSLEIYYKLSGQMSIILSYDLEK